MMLPITIFILLCGYTTAQFPYFGKCPSPDVQPDFDMKRFMGTWYEIQRTMSFLQLGSRCTSTNYSDSGYDDGSYEVINEGRAPILPGGGCTDHHLIELTAELQDYTELDSHIKTQLICQIISCRKTPVDPILMIDCKWKKSVRLIATVPDKNEPAKMQLRLSDLSVHGSYWILATDYDNYAIIWSCNHIWLTLQYARTENLWVYSRKRSFTDEIQEEVNRKLEAIKHIKVKKLLKKVSQKDCDDDDGTTPSPDDNETE